MQRPDPSAAPLANAPTAVPAVTSLSMGLMPLALVGTTIGGVELAGLDMVGLGLVGVAVILGLARGLWWQLIRLAGIVAAIVFARTFSEEGAAWIAERWPEISPRLAQGGAWIGLFLAAMIAATLLGMVGHRLLEAMQLGLANRLGGGLLGAATGVIMHLALIVGLVQLAPTSFVEKTVAGTYSEQLYQVAEDRWQGVLNPVAAAEVKRLFGADDEDEATPSETAVD